MCAHQTRIRQNTWDFILQVQTEEKHWPNWALWLIKNNLSYGSGLIGLSNEQLSNRQWSFHFNPHSAISSTTWPPPGQLQSSSNLAAALPATGIKSFYSCLQFSNHDGKHTRTMMESTKQVIAELLYLQWLGIPLRLL